jgi:hypothetical protein
LENIFFRQTIRRALVECRDKKRLVETWRAPEVIAAARALSGFDPSCACRIQDTDKRAPYCR